jgi:hypothetical protein
MLNRMILVASGMPLALTAALVSPVAAARQQPTMPLADDVAYVAVIDAGSSGTRLAVFTPDAQDSLTVERIFKSSPNTAALSSFVGNPADAGPKAIGPLLDQLAAFLDKQGIKDGDVPIALYATAGMRLVDRKNPQASRAIFESTGATLAASGHTILDNRILPGAKEALYAWVDANSEVGTIDDQAPRTGTVEIGGASAEVAFFSAEPRGPGVINVRVGGRKLPVVAVSYLGLGADQARDAMKRHSRGGNVCFPNNASGTNPEFYTPTSARPVKSSAALFRTSDCGAAYRSAIRSTMTDQKVPTNLVLRRLRERPGFSLSNFIGISTIVYTYGYFGLAGGPQNDLIKATSRNCSGDNAWPRVLSLFGEGSTAYADTLCSNGAYVNEFLYGRQGLGVPATALDPTPEGIDPTWIEGYALTVIYP